ncbi:MAG: hypothetical protein KIT14_12110 [bacterium]|nr:hypothetical protein [bacterium]
MNQRSGDAIGTWAAATTLLLGLMACSLPPGAARLVGSGVLVAGGVAGVLVGLVNVRWALRLEGHDLYPAILGTLVPAVAGVALLALAWGDAAPLLALRGLGVVVAGVGLALLLPPPAPVADALSRASGRRRGRRGGAVR